MTENSSTIRSLVRIIDQVDIPPAEVVSEFIKLERADVTKVVEMLKEVFDKGAQPTTPGAAPVVPGVKNVRPVVPGVIPQPQTKEESDIGCVTALSEDSIVIGKIKLAADVRTNRIHVITRPVNMPFIRKLIAEFDANVEFAKPVTRPLRYVSAAEILPVLVQALTEPGMDSQGGTAPGGGAQLPAPRTAPRPRSPVAPADSIRGSNTSGGGQNFSEELSTQAVDTAPQAVTIGNAKIIADQRANAIIVLGNREVVVKVFKILDEMDVKAPQVVFEHRDRRASAEQERGIWSRLFSEALQSEWRFTSRNHDASIAGICDEIPLARTLDPAHSTQSQAAWRMRPPPVAPVFFSAAGFGLNAIVSMLDQTGNFKVLYRPIVFTSNNKKAIIASGQEIPVPVSTFIDNRWSNIGWQFWTQSRHPIQESGAPAGSCSAD